MKNRLLASWHCVCDIIHLTFMGRMGRPGVAICRAEFGTDGTGGGVYYVYHVARRSSCPTNDLMVLALWWIIQAKR